ncbi:hypothetical protein ACQ5SO_14335 [Rhodovulum sp. DZ06]|uniref:hypothetical protein n=1 Tax=Rhodovulum sp. DZ06 TaxID=3425126 RepID=UPI003D328877
MRVLLYILAPIAFLCLAVATWATVLPACEASPWLGRLTLADCPPPQTAAQVALAQETRRQAVLEAEYARLQAELAEAAACKPEPRAHPGQPFDAERWQAGDLGVIQGCWALTGRIARADPQTGIVSPVERWTTCFDAAGAGAQEAAFADGAVCKGPASAAFREDGALELDLSEPAACSAGPALAGRAGACMIDAFGNADCVLSDGAADVDVALRRAEQE